MAEEFVNGGKCMEGSCEYHEQSAPADEELSPANPRESIEVCYNLELFRYCYQLYGRSNLHRV